MKELQSEKEEREDDKVQSVPDVEENLLTVLPRPSEEETYLSKSTFDSLYYSQRSKLVKVNSITHVDYRQFTPEEKALTLKLKALRKVNNDPCNKDFAGPWGFYEGEICAKPDSRPYLKEAVLEYYEKERPTAVYPQEMDPYFSSAVPRKVADPDLEASSQLHLEDEYQFEGFLARSVSAHNKTGKFFLPKHCATIFKGHAKAVAVARFLPKKGSFFLSGSFDATVKLWESSGRRRCVRTYKGHTEAVKDLDWSNEGEYFLSAGFDHRVRFWDTEKGAAVTTCLTQHLPYCVRLNPDADRQHLFLCATMGKKIEQWDLRTGKAELKYEDHMDPVNCIVFTDNNKKFVSFGDDRKVLLWEFGVPLVIRSIQDNDLPAITHAELHPSGEHILAQSSLNKICVFDVKNSSLRFLPKKKFSGHATAGFSVALCSAPNGKMVASGDQNGRLFFWDWKTSGILRTLDGHPQACTGVVWHPILPSTVLSYSWDGTLRLWE